MFRPKKKKEETVELGDRVRDLVTGMQGIAVSTTKWLQGCERIGIEPESLHESKPVDVQWFDIGRVQVIEKSVFQKSKEGEEPGGPQKDPSSKRVGEV